MGTTRAPSPVRLPRAARRARPGAFTLIELVIVVIVLAVLAAIGTVGYRRWIGEAQDVKAKEHLRLETQQALIISVQNGKSTWDMDTFTAALGTLAPSSTVSAGVNADGSGWKIVGPDEVPADDHQFSIALGGADGDAGVVTRSASGQLFAVVAHLDPDTGNGSVGTVGSAPAGTTGDGALSGPDPAAPTGSPSPGPSSSVPSSPSQSPAPSDTPGSPDPSSPAEPVFSTTWPTSVIDSTGGTFTGDGVAITGDLRVHGAFTCSGGFILTGSLAATGSVTIGAGCTITADVDAGGPVTETGGAVIGGAVTATGSVSLTGGASIGGSVHASGPVSHLAGTHIAGAISAQDPSTPPADLTATPPLDFDADAWIAQGWSVLTNDDCTQLNWNNKPASSVYAAIKAMATATVPTVIDTSCALSLSGGFTATLTRNLALVSSAGISMSGGARLSSSGPADGLYLIVPSGSSCSGSNGRVSLGGGTDVGTLHTFIYTPCAASIANGTSIQGSVFASPLTLSGAGAITSVLMPVPHRT